MLSGILEMLYLTPQEAGILYRLLYGYKEISFSNPLIAVVTLISVAWEYIKTLWDILSWNYAFFDGYWAIVRFFFIGISVGIVASLILSVTRGVSSA